MSTIRMHASAAPPGGLAKLLVLLTLLLEVFLDAQHQAAAAHKRYPFADW
jgi:hypothetical protein